MDQTAPATGRLTALLDHAAAFVRATYREHGDLVPMFDLVAADGSRHLMPMTWRDPDEKAVMLAAVRVYAEQIGATAYVFITETWIADVKPGEQPDSGRPPSQRADRQEGILAIASDGREVQGRQWFLSRRADGSVRLRAMPQNLEYRPTEQFHILPGAGHA